MNDRAPDNFHELRARHRLAGTLTTRTALHIGGGDAIAESIADAPVLRDALGRPFVPGSSLKGVVRSTVEGLLRGAGIDACDPQSKQACGHHDPGERQDAVQRIGGSCKVCRLFGSAVLASHVRFSDALLAPDRPARIEVRDGVAIDRDLRVVSRSLKYDFEVVAPGAEFALEVFVDNPEDWAMGLLLLGMEQLGDGFTALGGFSSRGLGRVEITWHELRTCTAKALLLGADPVVVTSGALDSQFSSWRDALAALIRGGL